ncbi:hypothetical protein SISNIDRAFT_482710 [Sistotremastrum niveocremeum HHB9708]|nr:hypothetical protein SISNIDRAFT_482710 [Sistotremastrum niveocremeum HHB9708]
MFYGEDGKRTMDHEADMYDNHLSTVQGTIVPELYGTFEAEPTPDKPNFRGCLVMEYCGTSPGQNIQSLPKAAKDELFRLASVLHDMEVHHGNLTGSSVVSRGHAFRIVGFSHASSRHKCPRPRAESPPQGSIEPALSHFSCAELFHLATSMNFWCKSFVTIYGKTFPDNALPSTEEMRKLYIECHFDGDEHEYNEFQDAQRRVAKLWAQVNMTPKVFL